jgi:hypothetical protein
MKFPVLFFWNQNVHCRVHNSLPLYTILSQTNPVTTHTPYSFDIHLNIIISCTSLFPLPFTFLPTDIAYAFIISAIRATCPAHFILLYLNAVITFMKRKLWSSLLCNFFIFLLASRFLQLSGIIVYRPTFILIPQQVASFTVQTSLHLSTPTYSSLMLCTLCTCD